MARPVWSGSLTFGLVTLPVSLVTATESHTIRFHQLERGTSDRVRNKRVNERTGEEVPYDKIVKGYDTGDGGYVVVEPEELDEIAPGRSHAIKIVGFAGLEEIEPVYFDSPYFVQPRDEAYTKVYGLLRDALEKSGKVGIATMSMRQKEYLVAVHTEGGVIVMHTLRWADEIRDPQDTLDNLPSGFRAAPNELRTATQLIEAMAMNWEPHDYHDMTQERVRELVEAKQAGKAVEKGAPAPEATEPLDLMTALRASLDRAHQDQQAKPAKKAAGGARRSGRKAPAARVAGGGSRTRTAKKTAPATDDLGRLTKTELYQRATAANIPGRSGMNRGELERALARATGQRRSQRVS